MITAGSGVGAGAARPDPAGKKSVTGRRSGGGGRRAARPRAPRQGGGQGRESLRGKGQRRAEPRSPAPRTRPRLRRREGSDRAGAGGGRGRGRRGHTGGRRRRREVTGEEGGRAATAAAQSGETNPSPPWLRPSRLASALPTFLSCSTRPGSLPRGRPLLPPGPAWPSAFGWEGAASRGGGKPGRCWPRRSSGLGCGWGVRDTPLRMGWAHSPGTSRGSLAPAHAGAPPDTGT